MKFLMMGAQAPTLHLTTCSLSPRFFILLSHVNPVLISTCPHISASALAAAKQEKMSSEYASGSHLSALPQATRGISLAGHLLLALGLGH